MGSKSSKNGFWVWAFSPKIDSAPLNAKTIYSQIYDLLYSKEPALQHSYNEAIDKIIFGTSRRISQLHELWLIYWLIRWNRVAKLILLNSINPIFENIYLFALRGAGSIFGWKCSYPEPISGFYIYSQIEVSKLNFHYALIINYTFSVWFTKSE
jgi:hypothetical protein